VPELDQTWLAELSEFLSIPSVSADPAHGEDVRRAADWVCDRVRAAGGDAEVVDMGPKPLAIGEIRASNDREAPTVLVYGHFDVQPPDPIDLWETEPFHLAQRNGWLYARGIADDKGQLYMLLKAAEALAAEGALPVNVRFACDGEEESGGHTIVDFLSQDERGADACVIFDGSMLQRGIPTFYVATRGLVYLHLQVRTGERDLHSGVYGGAALNAMHVLVGMLSAVLPRDGRLPDVLRAGVEPPTEEELAGWAKLPQGADVLADQGARPADSRAAEEFYLRTWAGPSLDVHGLAGGSSQLQKTVLPVLAEANLSIRLVADQDPDEIRPVLERLLREAAPSEADVKIEVRATGKPGLVSPDEPAVRLAQEAFERVVGQRPLLVRSGGSLPIVPALADKGIPTVLTGFDLPEGNIHSPNERLLAEHLPLGIAAARELFVAFRGLGSG
jgi:acetylornithine deacetylase/succinyl-diaminopimelate desuccinylase-like protein